MHVLNTSVNFDYAEILKFFKGVASSGAWVLFDEFNRIERGMINYIT